MDDRELAQRLDKLETISQAILDYLINDEEETEEEEIIRKGNEKKMKIHEVEE